MKHPVPGLPEIGTRDGLAYALFMPDEEPSGGIVILHGAGSQKESHFDFARAARASGFAALAFDQRGHGSSRGEWGPTAFGDTLGMCDMLLDHVPEVALRGSSMGGFCAIHAAALDPRVAGVAAICPAPEDFLLRGLRSGHPESLRWDAKATEPWLESLSLLDAAASLSPHTALLVMHAQGDEQIPYAVSEELDAVAGEPKRVLLLPGGHHRSLQHDMEMQAVTIRFVADAVRRRGRGSGPGEGLDR